MQPFFLKNGSSFSSDLLHRRLRSRLARRAPHDKLRGIFDFVDKWNGKRGRGRAGGHHVHGRLAAGAQVMVDGGEAGSGDGRGKDVVKAADGDLARDADALRVQLGKDAQGRHVVDADEGRGLAAAANELSGQRAADVVLVGQAFRKGVGLGAALGGENLQPVSHAVGLQLAADALQALAARQGELVEGG